MFFQVYVIRQLQYNVQFDGTKGNTKTGNALQIVSSIGVKLNVYYQERRRWLRAGAALAPPPSPAPTPPQSTHTYTHIHIHTHTHTHTLFCRTTNYFQQKISIFYYQVLSSFQQTRRKNLSKIDKIYHDMAKNKEIGKHLHTLRLT